MLHLEVYCIYIVMCKNVSVQQQTLNLPVGMLSITSKLLLLLFVASITNTGTITITLFSICYDYYSVDYRCARFPTIVIHLAKIAIKHIKTDLEFSRK